MTTPLKVDPNQPVNRRFLLLSPCLPFPFERHGGAQRTALFIEALRRHGEVDLLLVPGCASTVSKARQAAHAGYPIVGIADLQPEVRTSALTTRWYIPGALRGLCRVIDNIRRPYLPRPQLAAKVRALVSQQDYTAVVSRYLHPGAAADLSPELGVPLLLDFDDVDYVKLKNSQAARPWRGLKGRLGAALALLQLRRLTTHWLRRYDYAWVVQTRELALLGTVSAGVAPNIPYLPNSQHDGQFGKDQSAVQSARLLFVGNLAYQPNKDGLDRFIKNAWPGILERRPDAVLDIVGASCSDESRKQWSAEPGVNVIGEVDDLTPYYHACAFSICPVHWGGGSNIKVLESLLFQRPCILTQYAYSTFEGQLDSRHGVICATIDEAFVDACVELLNQPQLRIRLGGAGHDAVSEHFSRQVFYAAVDQGLGEVTACSYDRHATAPAGPVQGLPTP